MTKQVHEFELDKSLIIHLINSQAGSLPKALLECCMNSADAGATAIHIEVTSNTLMIRDDGHGLRTEDEILAVFKRFGFDHSQHKRTYGKFGLGRGQCWAYAATRWKSHGFVLDVNVRERGIKWFLEKDQPHNDGLIIEGDLYTPLTAVAMAQLVNEMERMCRYSLIPVFFNGRRLGKDPSKSKWDRETDEAFISVTDSAYLTVYNQGVLVRDIYAGSTGIGGTVVTKRGHALTLNIARNDILDSCGVWKKIDKELKKVAAERIGKVRTKRITDAERDFLAQGTADPALHANFDQPIFSLSDGKHLALDKFYERVVGRGIPLTISEAGNRIAETLMRDRAACVLSHKTLQRFNATTVAEFVAEVSLRLSASQDNDVKRMGEKLRMHTKVYEDISSCPGFRNLRASKIPDKDLSKHQRQIVKALKEMRWHVAVALSRHDGRQQVNREIFIGRGDAEAYTDGKTYIAFVDEATEKAAKAGLAGFIRLAHVMLHEMLHEEDDAGSHAHDPDFYQAYHDVSIHQYASLFDAAKRGFKTYAGEMERLNQRQATETDLLTRDGDLVPLAA